MGTVSQIAVAIAIFLAFAIGLNLGLHGVIYFHESSPLSAKVEETQVSTIQQSLPVIEQQRSDPVYVSKPVTLTTSSQNELSPVHSISKPTSQRDNVSPGQPSVPMVAITPASVLSVADQIAKIESELLPRVDLSKFSSSSLDAYKNTPIILLTCNRAALLRETIASLLTVRGVKKEQILVIQDGTMADVAAVVKENSISLVQNHGSLRRGSLDGAARIAEHYKFALSTGFDRFPSANAVIIVEDDLLFSPDFYEYLTSVAPILDADSSTFVVSAWNDNGFHGKVMEPYAIRRTEFFPGLGWILTRKLFKSELEEKWPHEHWDHWLRSPETHKNRESIYPQV